MKRILALTAIATMLIAAVAIAGEATGPQLEPGAKAPTFNLKGTDGKTHSFDEIKGAKGTVVIFTCNACPFSKAYEDRLIGIAKAYGEKGIGFVAINSNDPQIVPQDGFEQMVSRAKEKGFPFPYVIDNTQEVAKAYGAQVTPHVFFFDGTGTLRYRGRVDDNVKADGVKSTDLKDAIDAVIAGKDVANPTTKAFGCSVKWKKSA